MKKFEKEIKQAQLDAEKLAYEELSKTYRKALNDVNHKYKNLRKQFDRLMKLESQFEDDPKRLEIIQSQIQSKIYQIDYQESLRKQIDSAMKVLEHKTVKTCDDYMNKMYEEGFISQFYALQKRGVPVLAPINHKLMITAIKQDINGIPLSKRIYKNVDKAKKEIIAEISRGIATGMSNQDVARNIKNRMGVSYRKAKQLAQNEGARVRVKATIDSMREAKAKGADIVKQWDATFDGKTRPVHRELHGQYAEVEEDFKYSGGGVFAPKQFGIAELDINCRCDLLSVPRWDIEDAPQHMDNITGELIVAGTYEEWKLKYYAEIESENVRKGAELAKQSRERLRNAKDNVSSAVKGAVYGNIVKNTLNKNNQSVIIPSEQGFELDIQFFAEADLKNQSVTSLKRGIKTFEKEIAIHEAKIENPESFYPNWNNFDERYKKGLIKHWKKEISNFKVSIQNRIDELSKRGEKYE